MLTTVLVVQCNLLSFNPLSIFDYIGIPIAEAAGTTTVDPIKAFVGRIDRYILNPLIILMFSVALAYFLYGVVQYFVNSDQSSEREIGKSHLLWGLFGMFIMFAVGVILNIIGQTVGATLPITVTQ